MNVLQYPTIAVSSFEWGWVLLGFFDIAVISVIYFSEIGLKSRLKLPVLIGAFCLGAISICYGLGLLA